jgi:hypothetical protein
MFRSVRSIVIVAAKTGKAKTKINEVIKTDQQNNGNLVIVIPLARIFKIVTIKFNAPNKEETPAKCKLKIKQSTEGFGCPAKLLNGGYKVQPVPTPPSIQLETKNKNKEGGSNQKLKLFKRGKAISGAPIKRGTIQFPKPPIKIGIAAKKIITIP